jgi:hypothetical protein
MVSRGGFAPMALRAMTGWSFLIIFYNLFYFGYKLQNHFGTHGEHWNNKRICIIFYIEIHEYTLLAFVVTFLYIFIQNPHS